MGPFDTIQVRSKTYGHDLTKTLVLPIHVTCEHDMLIWVPSYIRSYISTNRISGRPAEKHRVDIDLLITNAPIFDLTKNQQPYNPKMTLHFFCEDIFTLHLT